MEVVLAASVVVIDDERRLLLARRGRPPEQGRWSVPGGKVEPGESIAEAIPRGSMGRAAKQAEVARLLELVNLDPERATSVRTVSNVSILRVPALADLPRAFRQAMR